MHARSDLVEVPVGAAREVTGRMVFVCLVAFFGVIAGVNAIMIRAAVSTFGGVETHSAYQAGLTFARETAAVRAQDNLHWQVMAGLKRLDGGASAIEVTVRDATGKPPINLSASALLVHPTDRRLDQTILLERGEPGQFNGTTDQIAGQWDLVIEFARDGERVFRSRNRILVR